MKRAGCGKPEDQGPGFYTINKFGENIDVDGDETIWSVGGQFPFIDTAIEMDILSTDPADTALGTGARTIIVTRYDNNNNLITEEKTLNGGGRVQLSGLTKISTRLKVSSSGDGNTNAGIIKVVDRATGAIIYQAIQIGQGQTFSAVQIVPAGKKGKVRSMKTTYAKLTNRNNARLSFNLRLNDGTIQEKYHATISMDKPEDKKEYKRGGLLAIAGNIFYWQCKETSAADTPIYAEFDLELEDE